MKEYQGKTLIPLANVTRSKNVVSTLESMAGGRPVVVESEGVFFKDDRFYMHYVYKWNGRYPRFLTCLKKFVNEEGKTVSYETTS